MQDVKHSLLLALFNEAAWQLDSGQSALEGYGTNSGPQQLA